MIALKDGQRPVVEQVDPVVDRFEELNVHRQSLLQILVGLANRFEFLADQDVLPRGRRLCAENHADGQLGLRVRRAGTDLSCRGMLRTDAGGCARDRRRVGERAHAIRGIVDELAQDRRGIAGSAAIAWPAWAALCGDIGKGNVIE